MKQEEARHDVEKPADGFGSNSEQESSEKNETVKRTYDPARELAAIKAKAEIYEKEWRSSLVYLESLQSQVAVLKDRQQRLEDKLRQERKALKDLSDCLARADLVIETLRQKLQQEQAATKALRADKEALEMTVRNLQQHVLFLDNQIKQLYKSYSWRITRPLRWAYGLLLYVVGRIKYSLDKASTHFIHNIVNLVVTLKSLVEKHPRMLSFMRTSLRLLPGFSAQIEKFLNKTYSWRGAHAPRPLLASETLSPRARFVAEQLKIAMNPCSGDGSS